MAVPAARVLIYALFALYPMVDGLWLSFFDWDGVSADRHWVGLENYVQIFTQDPVFWRAVSNSLIWSPCRSSSPRSSGWPSP